ncbi:MAG: CoB--CoM heterodisulfide reductase iron-sulfur subunit B family protein [Chloroflexi bacterium]|nr:CoB--CoM heterodisulfide reductase iron-sulfur subunit B family protein [Chloroflexota bacterium]MDA1228774.1 CoB--CoM heterodisulfide reductase iron-sulfur subunit B family protein [Chloroflexota bacterium]
MKYAFYSGCVAKGACPELYQATIEVCNRLGIELDEQAMQSASCTGAGVLQEKNLRLGDTLNARNFALAERSGLPLMTICSTCQGVMSQANARLKADPEYLASINEDLVEEGLEYKGTIEPKHLLWIIVEEVGIDKLKEMVVRPLTGFKAAPFYGCYIVRPSSALGFEEHPEREDSLERVIEAVGASVVEFEGKTACCGFPILTINQNNAMKMVSKHTLDAKSGGADAMVTPCPLCHLNLDGYQPDAAKVARQPIDLPILHLPQLIGLAIGIPPESMRLNKHIISTQKMLSTLAVAP